SLPWLRAQKGAMPNIEYHNLPVTPGHDALPCAAYAPQQLVHAERKRKSSGTYDKRWLAEDFPGLPRDFDFSMYNLTPLDQQFDGRFAGGEAYRLEGMHPTEPVLAGVLPAARARAFVLAEGQDIDATQEVALSCDTVWFFPEVAVGLMIFRGETVIADSDALDVRALMVAYESATDTPRAASHYRQVMALRLDPRTAPLHAFNESQLAPERSPQTLATRAAARKRQASLAQQKRQSVLDETMAEFWRTSGVAKPSDFQPPEAPLPQLPELSANDIAEGDFDLCELHASASALAAQARKDGEAKLAQAQASIPVAPVQPAKTDEAQLAAALTRAAEPARDLVADVHEAAMPQELADALARAQQAAPQSVDAAQQLQAQEAIAGIPALKRAARNAAPKPAIDALPESAANALGKQILEWHKSGEVLAGRDLAGACLIGADLRNADLREVQLERANLRGACLAGANLGGAVLSAALLDQADLSGACLDGANLCGSTAIAANFAGASLKRARAFDAVWSGADLRGAILDEALLMRIDLTAAVLDGTQLTRTVMMDARAADSRWVGSHWNMSVAPAAKFTGARFDGAQLTRSVLMDADLEKSSWQGASLNTVYAGGKSTWASSNLALMRAVKCGWRGASLSGAQMSGAVLTSCDFGDADLSGAQMDGAQLYRSLFLRSALRGIAAPRASFFQAMCRKADFTGADLSNAILVQADISEAVMHDVRMAGAKINQPARLP
ncbi:MAG TPA: pentapeptide repeat-containing protein, partial [Rhodocyclaceae bacterium]|nr:pentapeptide repeat-containing protein [Rhodocyclaceae bacterium]